MNFRTPRTPRYRPEAYQSKRPLGNYDFCYNVSGKHRVRYGASSLLIRLYSLEEFESFHTENCVCVGDTAKHSGVTKDVFFFLSAILFLLIPVFQQNLRSLLLPEKKHDRLGRLRFLGNPN